MIWAKDAKIFFIKAIYKNHFVALPTELFFKEVLVKKSKHIGLNYTKCNYKIGQICEVIFYQDDENNCCIAIVMELFFEEVMIKKNEQIGLL